MTEKKLQKKVQKKTDEVVKPASPVSKRLDMGEMRRLERIHAEMNEAKVRMHLQEQVLQNVGLKLANLDLVKKELEREALLVKERIKSEQGELQAKAKNLESFASELKTKYGLGGQELRYDMLSGEIQ